MEREKAGKQDGGAAGAQTRRPAMSAREGKLLLLATAGVGLVVAARALLRRWRDFDFAGKTVLITGGSRGLGLLLAREFARQGAAVAICARNAEELEAARQDLAARGADVLAVACDVTDREDVERLVSEVRRRFGSIDVLVNNAGVIQVGPAELMTLEDYEQAMKLHFWAPLYTVMAVAPEMRARRSGRIVNISSIGGKVSVPHLLPYVASKFALTGLSSGLRAELMKDGVLVTTVCPGLMRTGSTEHAGFKGQNKKEFTLFKLMDSLPITSVNAESAARQIVQACRQGDPELVISPQAKAAAAVQGVLPSLTSEVLGLTNRFLPGPGGMGIGTVEGKSSETALSASPLTALTDRAAEDANQ